MSTGDPVEGNSFSQAFTLQVTTPGSFNHIQAEMAPHGPKGKGPSGNGHGPNRDVFENPVFVFGQLPGWRVRSNDSAAPILGVADGWATSASTFSLHFPGDISDPNPFVCWVTAWNTAAGGPTLVDKAKVSWNPSGSFSVVNYGVSATPQYQESYAPASVPEPSSLALLFLTVPWWPPHARRWAAAGRPTR